MLEFFRQYQRYFFAIVTVVIIISFSFFGTYSSLPTDAYRDQVIFTTVDSTTVKQYEFDQFVTFISTDMEDKVRLGGGWGPNFLNDGVIKKDFLQTGLASILATNYASDLHVDLEKKQEKEKAYVLYSHPQAPFLNVENTWNYIAPDIKKNYVTLRSSPNFAEAFKSRIALYQAEHKLSPSSLRQILLYQQKQYSWLTPDPNLERADLSLFGYHLFEDWFGPRFLRLIAQFIMNSATIAEQRGYQVSKQEALADLTYQAELSYRQNINNPHLGVANSTDYLNAQLHAMHLDKNQAAALWRKVLLFRRLFYDMGNAVFVDPLSFQDFNRYTTETAEGDLYHLPKEFHFKNFSDIQKFELYLSLIAKRPDKGLELLSLPTQFFSVEEVKRQTPDLIQKRYALAISAVDKSILQAKVSLKETWNWETDEKNWKKLIQEFADLGPKKATDVETRYAALDSLDPTLREKVDEYARLAILDTHPEWLEQALEEAPIVQQLVAINFKKGKTPVVGLEDRAAFITLLDQAKLKEPTASLKKFTADKLHYYTIIVEDRAPKEEILTFAEAQEEGILDKLLDQKLEAYYQKIRPQQLQDFQQADKSWKSFSEVKNRVAELYFANLQKAIYQEYATSLLPSQAPASLIPEISASLRLKSPVKELLTTFKKSPESIESVTKREEITSQEPLNEEQLEARHSIADQWQLKKSTFKISRGHQEALDLKPAFTMQVGEWSELYTPASGDLYFFQLKKHEVPSSLQISSKKVIEARRLLSQDAQHVLMEQLLSIMKEKKALSLDYLNRVNTPVVE